MYGDVTRVGEVEDLGDEAWLLWVNGNGTQVTYHWRRGNGAAREAPRSASEPD